ncbi:GntR family transcriptional regulator [Ignatzschineria rhizosphaerae]|uniref:GntR family transcriptional regulator n=1 Tax=Ignatzschineria rhizosphaerae TaxID=2923279 RepID=A0ABY3X8M6_9GAMM|nr:GntR family transcriptional regulator [Ignatzschineria rhizosphaerae]UNM97110.1 GntR family transcriptional regulator [Ignatzschineria rhizosphaerae]
MKKLKKIESLSDQAFELLREAILNNVLEPGKLYSATEIGEWVGASRTPIREAAQQLANIGLVRIERNRGIRILPTSLKDLLESFQIRLMLEVPLVRKVAMIRTEEDIKTLEKAYNKLLKAAESDDAKETLNADKDYHSELLKIAAVERALAIIDNTRNTVLLTGPSTIPHSRTCMEAFEDHKGLHEAILKGDPETAGKEMERHIINTARLLVTQESGSRENWNDSDLLEQFSWIHK